MSVRKSDDRLEAFNAILGILGPLERDSQLHILNSVTGWLGLGDDARSQPSASEPNSVSADPSSPLRSFSKPSGDLSPKEFVTSKGPQTNTERIACLAFYLTYYRDTPHFKTLELSKLNTEAAQPRFSNASYTMRDAATAGLLVSGPKGTKQLSAMGEQFVLALPDRDAAKEVLHRMKPKRRKRVRTVKKKGR